MPTKKLPEGFVYDPADNLAFTLRVPTREGTVVIRASDVRWEQKRNLMDTISLSIVGICLGHPKLTSYEQMTSKFSVELEALDNAFDDAAYNRDWLPWEEERYLEFDEDGDVTADYTTALDQLGAIGLTALEVFLARFGAFARAITEGSHA